MQDLISRQAAIDWASKIPIHDLSDGRGFCRVIFAEDFLKAVKTFPLVQSHWIPCSERLPEKSGRYLVTRGLNACGSLWNRIYISNYSDLMGIKSEKIWWQGNVGKPDFKRLDDVIAWMPLPEPYKGEES